MSSAPGPNALKLPWQEEDDEEDEHKPKLKIPAQDDLGLLDAVFQLLSGSKYTAQVGYDLVSPGLLPCSLHHSSCYGTGRRSTTNMRVWCVSLGIRVPIPVCIPHRGTWGQVPVYSDVGPMGILCGQKIWQLSYGSAWMWLQTNDSR